MRLNSGPGLPDPTGRPSNEVTASTPRVAKLSQISSAERSAALGHAIRGVRDLQAIREFPHDIAGRARQDVVAVGRRMDDAARNHVHRGGRAFGELAVLDHDGLERAGVGGELLEQHIGEEGGRLDVAPRPASIGRRHGGHALVEQRRGRRTRRGDIGEHRRAEALRPRVIAAEFGSPRSLECRCRIPGPPSCASNREHIAAHSACDRGAVMRMPARLRFSRSRCSRSRNGRPPYTGMTS